MTPGQGAIRLTRVALFALSAVALASGAHAIGGGTVSPVVAVLAVPAVMLAMNLLAGRRRGLASLLPAMASIQLVLHEAFMLVSNAQGCRIGGTGGEMAQMDGAGGHFIVQCSQGSGMTMSGIWPPSLMLLAHLLAAGALVLLLTHGETAIWALVSWLGFRVLRLRPVHVPVPARALPILSVPAFQPVSAVHRRNIRRRGPPRRFAVV